MRLLFLLIIITSTFSGWSQSYIKENIQTKMDEMGVTFLEPVDSKYEIKYPNKRRKNKDLYTYDFRVEKDGRTALIKLIKENNAKAFIRFPHLEFHRLLTLIASNESESTIYIYDVPEDEGVDWMSEARFTPKDKLSENEYGTAKVYYKKGVGMIQVIYLDRRIQAGFEPFVSFNEGIF